MHTTVTVNKVVTTWLLDRSVVAKDLDSDGNEDLVIGSPGHSDSNEPQRGRVYILYST